MNDDSLKFKIGITLIKGIGNNLAKNLIAYIGSEEGVFKENQKNLSKIPGIGEILSKEIVSQTVLSRAELEIEFILKNKIQTTYFTDRDYPFRLKECPDSPIMIYSKGNCDLNNGKFVGIVGTRNATETGKENCKILIAELAASQPKTIIVSGMAYGIDICAHKAALEAGLPTIGVLGHGLDRIYPAAHRPTAVKMLPEGALLTEYLSQTNPDRQNFVQRNRIIAGLCDAVVVVESAARGGALITAEVANDYNRDVFAFPGRVTDEWSAGCNALIKNNKASLIESTHLFSIGKTDNSFLNSNHVYGYAIYKNTNSVLFNYNMGVQLINRSNLTVVEGNASVRFKHSTGLTTGPREIFDVGLTYSTSSQLTLLLGLNISSIFRVGYAFSQSFISLWLLKC